MRTEYEEETFARDKLTCTCRICLSLIKCIMSQPYSFNNVNFFDKLQIIIIIIIIIVIIIVINFYSAISQWSNLTKISEKLELKGKTR